MFSFLMYKGYTSSWHFETPDDKKGWKGCVYILNIMQDIGRLNRIMSFKENLWNCKSDRMVNESTNKNQ